MVYLKFGLAFNKYTILFLIFLFNYTSGEYANNCAEQLFTNGKEICVGTNCPENQSGNGVAGAMWFGPRLGRRRRSDGMATDNENDLDIFNTINSRLWNFRPYRELKSVNEKKHTRQFTPRLGREVGDEYFQRIITIDDDNHLSHLLDTKSSDAHHQMMPPSSLFQPRLGRQQIYMPTSRFDYRLPESVRNF